MSENEYVCKIKEIMQITHDVKRFRLEKPKGFTFVPGNANLVSINKENFKDKQREFTFTSLPEDNYIEFTIKIYSDHPGVTFELNKLDVGDELIIRDPWGSLQYQGPGVFIAGGAGITPFISILRMLKKENKIENNILIFANKTEADIILKDELLSILGNNCFFILSREKNEKYDFGIVNEEYLKSKISNFNQNFYICGPPQMQLSLQKILPKLGAKINSIVFEK